MSLSSDQPEEVLADWEITPDGLYIATRHFLLRRGYCCANRCRHCPYINWQNDPCWQHAPLSAFRRALVSPKALAAARALLASHIQALASAPEQGAASHRELIEYYQALIERWS